MPEVPPSALVLAILLVSLVLFVTEAVRYEIVALGIVLALALTGCLEAEVAFRGFSSPAVVLIASMYVFGHAFTRSGLPESLGRRIIGRARKGHQGEAAVVLRVTALSGLLSSVLSNTGVVATLIPVCNSAARRLRIPLSRILLPMAFGSLVGGLVTVIATSTNIAINDLLRDEPVGPFGMFEFTHLGLILLAIATLYLAGPGRWLLPRSSVDKSLAERYQVPKFVTEVLVEPSSNLINRNVADADVFAKHGITVLGIVRPGSETPVLAPGPYNRIRAEDTLILQGSPEDLLGLDEEMPLKVRESVEAADTRLYSDDVRLFEAVVPAASDFVGQSLRASDFRTRTGLNVLALSKHGSVQLRRLQDTPMEVGDTLLLQGHVQDIVRARRERQLLVLDEVQAPRPGRRSWITLGVLLAILGLAASTEVSLAVLGLAGALTLVVTRVLRAEEVPRAIDWSVVVLVGGMLALGEAFERHGLSKDLADWLAGLGEGGMGPRLALSIVLVGTVLLTQVLNNVTTAVIMTPVAIGLAGDLGVDPKPLLMGVVTGSSLAFLSPVAHQANMMVMGPGGYRYLDYVRVGVPLAAVTIASSVLLIPWLWPF